jgi:hypothetical protein
MRGVTLLEDLDYIPAVSEDGGYLRSRQLETASSYPQPRPQASYYAPQETEHIQPQPVTRCSIDDISMSEIFDFIDEHPMIRKAYETDVRPYILIIIVLVVLVAFLLKKAFFSEPSNLSFPDLSV